LKLQLIKSKNGGERDGWCNALRTLNESLIKVVIVWPVGKLGGVQGRVKGQ